MADKLLLRGDVADLVSNLMTRLSDVEQHMTSPTFTIPNGAIARFKQIKIADYSDDPGTLVIVPTSSSPTNIVVQPGALFEDIFVDVTWSQPSDGSAIDYQVLVARKTTVGGVITYLPERAVRVTGPSAHISGLLPNTTYGLMVYGINRIGAVSAPAPATGYVDFLTIADATQPGLVAGLNVTPTATGALVKWNDNTEVDVANGAGLYRVQWSTAADFSTLLGDGTTAGTIFAIYGLDPANGYYFRVAAVDSSNNQGPWATTATPLTPGQAVGVVGSGGGPSGPPSLSPSPVLIGSVGPTILVKFSLVSTDFNTVYEIHLSATSGFATSSATKVAEVTSSNVMVRQMPDGSPLAYNLPYYVKIVAKNSRGSAAESAQGSVNIAQASGNDLAAGSITAASGIIGSLDASKISTGSMDAQFLTANTITSDKVSVLGLDAGVIKFGVMSGDRIDVNSLSAASLKSSTLSVGTITLASNGQVVGGLNPLGGSAATGWILNSQGLNIFQNGISVFSTDASGNVGFSGNLVGASGTFTGTVQGGTLIATTLPTSVYGTNAVVNFNFEDFHPLTGEIKGWNYQVAPGGATYGLGNAFSTGTTWSVSTTTASPLSGRRSLVLGSSTNGGGVGISSTEFGVIAGEKWHIQADFAQIKAATGGQYRGVYVTVLFYTSAGVLITNTPAAPLASAMYNMDSSLFTTPATVQSAGRIDLLSNWVPTDSIPRRMIGTVTVPATAFLARVVLIQWSQAAVNTTTTTTEFDGVMARKTLDASYYQGGRIIGASFVTDTNPTKARVVIDATATDDYGGAAGEILLSADGEGLAPVAGGRGPAAIIQSNWFFATSGANRYSTTLRLRSGNDPDHNGGAWYSLVDVSPLDINITSARDLVLTTSAGGGGRLEVNLVTRTIDFNDPGGGGGYLQMAYSSTYASFRCDSAFYFQRSAFYGYDHGVIVYGDFQDQSDIRTKANMAPLSDVLTKLRDINPVSFARRSLHLTPDGETMKLTGIERVSDKRTISVPADEIQVHFPEAVSVDNAGIKANRLASLASIAIAGVKELTTITDSHDERLKRLESKIEALSP